MTLPYAVGYATARLNAARLNLDDALAINPDEVWSATALRAAVTVALQHVTEALNALNETKEEAA